MCTKISIAYKVDIPGRQKPVFLPSIILSTDLFITSKNRLSLAFATQKCQRAFYLLMRLRYYIIKWNMSGFCASAPSVAVLGLYMQRFRALLGQCASEYHDRFRSLLGQCASEYQDRFRALLGQCASVYNE